VAVIETVKEIKLTTNHVEAVFTHPLFVTSQHGVISLWTTVIERDEYQHAYVVDVVPIVDDEEVAWPASNSYLRLGPVMRGETPCLVFVGRVR